MVNPASNLDYSWQDNEGWCLGVNVYRQFGDVDAPGLGSTEVAPLGSDGYGQIMFAG